LIRSRILTRVGASLDEAISERVYDGLVCLALKAGKRGDGLQSLRHLDNLRNFLSGMGPITLSTCLGSRSISPFALPSTR
jgi:ATP-binding cassette subfamily C protein